MRKTERGEPTPSPSQEGTNTGWPVPLMGGVRVGLVRARFPTSVRPVALTSPGWFALISRVDGLENSLEPLSYHFELRDYLKSHERELWNWFASAQAQADYTENLRMELLKSTYRLDAETHPQLHESVAEAKARLDLDIPVTLYQGQSGG